MTKKLYKRGWCDGCFDVTHFGHFNFMRQASEVCEELYVGVHRDEEVAKNKCPPVFSYKERLELVSSCKWVKKVIGDAPYTTNMELVKKMGCDVVLHGDDPCFNSEGQDIYKPFRDAGMYHELPRTKAISTTNIIGRMLRLPKSMLPDDLDLSDIQTMIGDSASMHSYIPTTHRICQFSSPREPTENDVVVYVDGTFDLLHPGHVSFLKKAKEFGTYLVVGVHPDPLPGEDREVPVETLQERVLNVLALKYVDDVIIGAPYIITRGLIEQINPRLVMQGSNATRVKAANAFKIPKELGIFKQIESDYPDMTYKVIIRRVLENYKTYANRNTKRESAAYEKVVQ